jgi:D-arabinose 1-dehydrogenase-like Zn-dependent alcohol dehydrogenase
VEQALPEVGPGQVLVRVAAIGVCFRDLIEARGGYPNSGVFLLGHEFSGVVIASSSPLLPIGTRVTNLHTDQCGSCVGCTEERKCRSPSAVFSLTQDGGYASHVLAPASALVPVPSQLSLLHAAFLGCTAAVALRGLRRAQVSRQHKLQANLKPNR